MKVISWNVNGMRACLKKGFNETFAQLDADVFCLQETKMEQGQAEVITPGYHQFWFSSAKKKGYSGTAIFTREEPISVVYGIGEDEFDCEGRAITCEFDGCFVVGAYVPNAQPALARIEYRVRWETLMREYLGALSEKKPVIYCGDLNVAHNEIDLENPSANRGNPGFSDEERAQMTALLQSGFTDTFRHLYPDAQRAYSWWSYRAASRERNVGWRIDYVLASPAALACLEDSFILPAVMGSDHCPVGAVFTPFSGQEG